MTDLDSKFAFMVTRCGGLRALCSHRCLRHVENLMYLAYSLPVFHIVHLYVNMPLVLRRPIVALRVAGTNR